MRRGRTMAIRGQAYTLHLTQGTLHPQVDLSASSVMCRPDPLSTGNPPAVAGSAALQTTFVGGHS